MDGNRTISSNLNSETEHETKAENSECDSKMAQWREWNYCDTDKQLSGETYDDPANVDAWKDAETTLGKETFILKSTNICTKTCSHFPLGFFSNYIHFFFILISPKFQHWTKCTKSEAKRDKEHLTTMINYILKFIHLVSCYVLWRYK